MIAALLITLWFLCGLYSFGIWRKYCRVKYDMWLGWDVKKETGMFTVCFLSGPISLLPVIFMSDGMIFPDFNWKKLNPNCNKGLQEDYRGL